MSWTITGNPVALCDTQHAGKEIVTRPTMSEYFANDPECHDLLLCALRSYRVAGLGGMSHRAACGWSHVHVDSGPVALYLLQWPPFRAKYILSLGKNIERMSMKFAGGITIPSYVPRRDYRIHVLHFCVKLEHEKGSRTSKIRIDVNRFCHDVGGLKQVLTPSEYCKFINFTQTTITETISR